MTPRVGVVVPYSPAHTPESMLDEAVASAREQAVPTNVYVVTDDDGECGPAWARNRGLERASERYVAFLDADDRWHPGKLAVDLDQLGHADAGVSVAASVDDAAHLTDRLLFGDLGGITSSLVVDTDHVTARFDESLERFEDHLFAIEAAHEAGVCTGSFGVEVRKHEDGLSATGDWRLTWIERLKFADRLRDRDLVTDDTRRRFRARAHYAAGVDARMAGEYAAAGLLFWAAMHENPAEWRAVRGLAGLAYATARDLVARRR